MYPMNLEENQGFLGWILAILTLIVLICYTWSFYWDVSWMLYHRKTNKFSKFLKNVQILKISSNFKIRVYFWFMGLGQFLSVDWFFWLLWLRKDINIASLYTSPSSSLPTTSSVCASQSLQFERVVCHHWFACAMGLSTVPVCQHARGVPACRRVIPEVPVLPWMIPGGSSSPRCPEGQDVVWLCQMAQNFTRLYLWLRFICSDDFSMFFSLMWWPIGCVCYH